MPTDKISQEEMGRLIEMLERRLEVIGDAKLRAEAPEKQLALLKEVSEAIVEFHMAHRAELSPRLNHFLENCSFEKALDWAKSSDR